MTGLEVMARVAGLSDAGCLATILGIVAQAVVVVVLVVSVGLTTGTEVPPGVGNAGIESFCIARGQWNDEQTDKK